MRETPILTQLPHALDQAECARLEQQPSGVLRAAVRLVHPGRISKNRDHNSIQSLMLPEVSLLLMVTSRRERFM